MTQSTNSISPLRQRMLDAYGYAQVSTQDTRSVCSSC